MGNQEADLKVFAVSRVLYPAAVFCYDNPFAFVSAKDFNEAAGKLNGLCLDADEVCNLPHLGGEKWRVPELYKKNFCVIVIFEGKDGELFLLQELPDFPGPPGQGVKDA